MCSLISKRINILHESFSTTFSLYQKATYFLRKCLPLLSHFTSVKEFVIINALSCLLFCKDNFERFTLVTILCECATDRCVLLDFSETYTPARNLSIVVSPVFIKGKWFITRTVHSHRCGFRGGIYIKSLSFNAVKQLIFATTRRLYKFTAAHTLEILRKICRCKPNGKRIYPVSLPFR